MSSTETDMNKFPTDFSFLCLSIQRFMEVSTSDKTKLLLKKNHITNDKLVAADTRVYEMKTHVKNSF